MTTEAGRVSPRARRTALAIALAVVLLACAWLATHDGAEPALALTHATSAGMPPATRSTTAAAQERRLVAALEQALATSAPRTTFPALTATGRAAWASVAPISARPPAAAPADATASAVAVAPEFPFQWVGTLRPSGTGKDAAESQPVAILAGPNATRMVKQGDVVEEDWKIASLSAEQLQVIHLPSSSRQTITKNKQ